MATKVEGVANTPERAEIGSVVDTDIAGRLDRLPWGRFHVWSSWPSGSPGCSTVSK